MNNTPKMRSKSCQRPAPANAMRAKSCQRPAPANASNDHGRDLLSTILDANRPTTIMGLDNRAPLTAATKITKTAMAGPGATSPATSPNYENRPPPRSPATYGSSVPHGAGANASGAVHRIDTSADPRLQPHPSTSTAAQQRLPSTKASQWKKHGPPSFEPSTSPRQPAVTSPTLSMSPDIESNASVPTTPSNPDDHSTCARSLRLLQERVKRRDERIAKLEQDNERRKEKETELRQRHANNEKYFLSQQGKLEKQNAALLHDQKLAQEAAEAKSKEQQAALDKLEDENMELQVAKQNAEQKAASLQHRLDAMTTKVESLEQEKKDLAAQCESLESVNAQLDTESEALREQVANITKLQDQASKRADELQKKVEELTQKATDAEEAAQLALTEVDEQANKISELTEQLAAQATQLQLATDEKQRAEKRNESLIQQLAEVARRMRDRKCLQCSETEHHIAQLRSENDSLQKALAEERRSNDILREQFKALDLALVSSTSGAFVPSVAAAPTSDANIPYSADGNHPTKKRAVAGDNDAAPVAAVSSAFVPTPGANQTEPPRKLAQVKKEAIQAQKSNVVAGAPTSSEQQSEDQEVLCSRHVSKKNRRSGGTAIPKAEMLEASEGTERSFSNATTVSVTSLEASPDRGPATSCDAGTVPPVGCDQSAAQSRSEPALPVTQQQQPQAYATIRECLQPSVDLNPLVMPWPQQQFGTQFPQHMAQFQSASNVQMPYNSVFPPQFQGSMTGSTAMPGMMAPSMGARMGAAQQMPQATFGAYPNYGAHHDVQHQPAAQQYRHQYPQPTMSMPQQQQMPQTQAFMQQQRMGAFARQQHQPHAMFDALSPQQLEEIRQIAQELQQLSPQQIGLATAARHQQHDVVNDALPNAQMRQ
ncbi:viral A-type inclusion protein [Aphelenchoides avenae]|nr:viral A-type inclusion protein [Aphelenchus avenae]